jgi:hypothetical protein
MTLNRQTIIHLQLNLPSTPRLDVSQTGGNTHTLTIVSVFLSVTMVNLVGFVFTYMVWLTGRNAHQVPPERK